MKKLEDLSVPRLLLYGALLAVAFLLTVATFLRLIGWRYWGAG